MAWRATTTRKGRVTKNCSPSKTDGLEKSLSHRAKLNDAPIEPLQYIQTIDEPYARKLESIQADFAWSTRLIDSQKMKVSSLID
jgi:hypothetical protein